MKSIFRKTLAGVSLAALLAAPTWAAEQSVEVLHWWTSGGEAAALNVLKQNLEKEGVTWNDMPVAGGGGEQAMTALRARVTAGDPPTAVQMQGFDITDWAKQGVLSDLSDIASKNGWSKVVPAALQKFSVYKGKWIAVPVNIHSTNWIWANAEVLKKSGVSGQPKTWEDFISALQKVQNAGFIALAAGGQPWQEATMFEAVLIATGGVDFYRKALIDLNQASLNSPTMVKSFQRMSQLRKFVDKDFSGRDWNLASTMVINGKAGFQMMGDWAKGEFIKAKKVPGKDFLCFRTPGTQGVVPFNTDQFVTFKQKDANKATAQLKLATAIMDPAFQSAFNVVKGSVPARTDASDAAFDACGKQGMKDVVEASGKNTLVGSMAHGYAVPAAIKNAFYDVITRHFNSGLSDADAAKELAKAAQN